MAQVVVMFAVFAGVIALGVAMFLSVGSVWGIPPGHIVKAIMDGDSLVWLFSFAGVWTLAALCLVAKMNTHKGE